MKKASKDDKYGEFDNDNDDDGEYNPKNPEEEDNDKIYADSEFEEEDEDKEFVEREFNFVREIAKFVDYKIISQYILIL